MSANQHAGQPAGRPLGSLSELVLVAPDQAQGWRVRQDERLDHLFEERCDWVRDYGSARKLAVDSDELSLTYAELDARANQLARYLRLRGAGAGHRIALLFDSPAHSYIAMLAVLKIGATYVPLDVTMPTGRLAYIVEDARAYAVLSMARVADRVNQIELLTGSGAELVYLDGAAPLIADMDPRRLIAAERGVLDNQLAYISYTSVSGRPEGVAIEHRAICNFVKVAAEVYGIRPRDRVYQGLALALDFAVEEIWVPWVCGATLVPKPAGDVLQGPDLQRFLRDRGVTALCCVPGTLAAMTDDLPELRFLLMCGKDCPSGLIERWQRPGRRFLNVYGPTEATVTATWSVLHPEKPATIGLPLPTYSTVILDVRDPYRALPHGQLGEIGIAGIGLACGYLNHDDLTEEVFIPDFLCIPGNPSGRIYRTGDLGRVNSDGELEYHGRVDARAQAPNYRLELTEIQTTPLIPMALAVGAGTAAPASGAAADTAAPASGAAADTAAPASGAAADTAAATPVAWALADLLAAVVTSQTVSLDSHFFDDLGADSLVMAQFCARVRKRADLPSVSMKDIYRYPTIRSLAAALADTDSSPMERSLVEVLSALMGTPVSIDSHFFDDLGADSLVMAQFCARVRKRVDLPSVSMKDIYQYPTIRGLATAFADPAAGALAPPAPGPVPPGSPAPGAGASVAEPVEVARASTASYIACGVLQLVAFLGYLCLTTTVLVRGFEWISVAPDAVHVYLRSLLFCGLGFIVLCLFPILAKWMLVDRWTPREIPVWSLAYFRFWVVKTLIRTNPLVLFAGSPLYVLYLRALGAKIGRGVAIFSRNVPVCTDLLTIGDGTVIRKDSYFLGYRAHAGVIQTGPVTLGRDVFVGEKTVLEIGAWMGDGAQLGHTSALHAGQGVPAGERWHGSPAQRTTTDYRAVPSGNRAAPRTVCYSVLQLLNPLILVPLGVAIATLAIAEAPRISRLLGPELLGPGLLGFTSWRFYLALLGVSAVLFFGGVLLGFIVLVTVPRLLRLAITPGKVYPLYGIHYWVHRRIAGITNSKFFTELFGDTSYIVHYLRSLGYDLSPVEQTGSNFGMSVQHESPFVSSVGAGTVVADGLSIINADFSNSSFRVSRASIGRHNFLGNHIAYPAQGRTGDNCLLATKVMVPIDGPIREGVGLLGSPCFEVPRTVERDKGLDVRSPDELRRGLAAKNRHNLVSIAWRLLVRWVHFFGLMVLVAVAAGLYDSLGALAFVLDALVVPVFTVAYFVLVERAVDGLHTLVPGGCSIYDRVFWRHERSWKVPSESYFQAFDGTPFKSVLWRLLGVRVGRRIFDDGCFLTERPFVALGDYCTLNPGSVVQCHSQEDGAFKSDVTAIGAGCTLGVGAFVHYGVTIGDGATLAADSFLMKGEEIPPHERWGGNPASELRHDHYRATERSGRTVPSVAA